MPRKVDTPLADGRRNPSAPGRFPAALIWILALAFVLRAILLVPAIAHPERAWAPDTASYFSYARAMLQGQAWDYPSAMRTPGYPLFLALGSLAFGETPAPFVFVQILISTFAVFMTFLLGRALIDEKTGLLAALLLAVSAESITHSFFLLSETLFTFLFSLSIWALWRSRGRSGWVWPAAAGLLLGLGILTRPLAVYFPLLAFPLLLLEKTTWAARLRNAAVFLAASFLLVVPWVIRNAMIVGIPTLSTISNYNLLYYNAASLEADRTGLTESEVQDELNDRVDSTLAERGLPDNVANRTRLEGELARELILSDPFRYTWLHLKDDLNNLLPDTDLLEIWGLTAGQSGTLEVLKQQGLGAAIRHYFDGKPWALWLLLPEVALLGLTYLGWATGSVRLAIQRQAYPLLVLGLPIAYSLLLPGSPSNPRFRVPVMPYLCILAAFGLFYIWNKLATRKGSKT